MKKILLCFLPLLACLILNAQGDVPAENNNGMGSEHKIYVVAAVLFIILSAMFIFLFSIERRLKRLEDNPTGKR